MEIRFQRILLVTYLSLLVSMCLIAPTKANQSAALVYFNETSLSDASSGKVDVDVERRTVVEDILDNENFELSGCYLLIYNIKLYLWKKIIS